MSNRPYPSRFVHAVIVLFATARLFSASAFAQGDESAPPPTPVTNQIGSNTPSVEQALVPEGVLALKLVEALKLGTASDEAKAESLLSSAGIEPKRGWITDYPVTPAVIGEIETGIATASDQGKLALSKDQALKTMDEVKTQLGLAVSPGTKPPEGLIPKPRDTTIYTYTDSKGVVHYTNQYDSVPSEYRANAKIIRHAPPHEPAAETEPPGPPYAANPGPEVVNNYYYEAGPPVVTYYPPPEPYYYLYSWVPYPFWSTGFYFPGFFILHDFHRHVVFQGHPHFVSHHGGPGGFRRPFGVGPINKGLPGSPPPHWFSAPGARAILTLNQNRLNSINGTVGHGPNTPVAPPPRNGWAGLMRNVPTVMNGPAHLPNGRFRAPSNFGYGGRAFRQPVFNHSQLAPFSPRVYYPPVYRPGRNFGAPRLSSGSSLRGFRGGGTVGGFHGSGGLGGFGRGHR